MSVWPEVLIGDTREVLPTLASESVHCVVTSPPYHGLRDYGTALWEGGDPGCEHVQMACGMSNKNTLGHAGHLPQTNAANIGRMRQYRDVCGKCGAHRLDRQIGLEPTVDDWVAEMVQVMREVRRVLRKDGTLWLNLGDSYACTPNGRKAKDIVDDDRTFRDKPFSTISGTLKPKDLVGQPWRLAFALQADGWWLRSAITLCKCLSGGTRVYARTQKGDMPMTIKDLVRLRPETVQLWNGMRWTQVISWQETPRSDTPLEIELRSGERIGCTENHLWPTQRGNVRADELEIGDTIQTCRLPCESWTYPKGLASVGWFVGLYIAEGSKSDTTIQISGHLKEKDRYQRLCELAADYHGTCRVHALKGQAATINLYGPTLEGILDTYVSGTGAHGKHLNVRCWERSNEFLQEVLMGYLEADGHWVERQRQWQLGFCDNDNWAADLRTICARLGVSLRLKRCFHVCNGKKFPGYRGHIRLEKSYHPRCKQDGEVVAIRKSRARKFWDIAVEDEPHLFALASGVLTHNSNPMPESVTDRPTQATEMLFLLTKAAAYYYDADALREPLIKGNAGSSFSEGKTGVNGNGRVSLKERIDNPAGRNMRNWLPINSQPTKEAHFATFSERIPEIAILAGTSERGCCPTCGAPWRRVVERKNCEMGVGGGNTKYDAGRPDGMTLRGGGFVNGEAKTTGWQPTCSHAHSEAELVPCTVLDIFAGSGTTLRVATRLGRKSIGIELNEQYVDIVRKRTAQGGLGI